MTSSPGSMTASMVAIMHSVAPQQTVTFASGSQGMPLNGRGLAEDGRAPGDGVLVDAVLDRPAGGVLDLRRGVEVRHALAQVERAVLGGQPGHFADHRFGEELHSSRQHQDSFLSEKGCPWGPLSIVLPRPRRSVSPQTVTRLSVVPPGKSRESALSVPETPLDRL